MNQFERIAALIGILSATAIAAGVLYNSMFFWLIGSKFLTVLTLTDHIAAATATLPYFAIGYPVWLWMSYFKHKRRRSEGYVPGISLESNSKYRWWVEIALLAMSLIPIFFGLYSIVITMWFWIFFYFWLHKGDEILGDHFGVEDTAWKFILWFGILIITSNMTSGLSRGLSVTERKVPDVILHLVDNKKVEGIFVMYAERGTFLKVSAPDKLILIHVNQILSIERILRTDAPVSCDIAGLNCP